MKESFDNSDQEYMNFETLDLIFPFFVFSYGILMTSVLESAFFQRLAEERMPSMVATLRGHRGLAWTCLFVGGLWSLQNLWFGLH